jgi:hypothetical protein
MRAAALVVATLVSACLPLDDGAYCRTDRDCNEVCTDIGECASADNVRALRIEWTVAGVKPTVAAPEPCVDNDVSEMTVRVSDGSSRDALTYEPVPCEAGQFSFSALPLRYDWVQVVIRGPGGTLLDTGTASLTAEQTSITLDLL